MTCLPCLSYWQRISPPLPAFAPCRGTPGLPANRPPARQGAKAFQSRPRHHSCCENAHWACFRSRASKKMLASPFTGSPAISALRHPSSQAGLGNDIADQKSGGHRHSQGCSLHNRPNPIPTLRSQRSMAPQDNHDGALAVPWRNQGVATVLSGRQDHPQMAGEFR